MATFIQSIREILKASDHDPALETVDLASTIETAIDGVDRPYQERIRFDPPLECRVLAGDLLERAFTNLIENAFEHNADVTVAVTIDEEDGWVTVSVEDDGAGIPDDERDGLFDPPESGDHGYGLFLTKNLIEVYGGRLELAETGPDGTVFVVRLRPPNRERSKEATSARPKDRRPTAADRRAQPVM